MNGEAIWPKDRANPAFLRRNPCTPRSITCLYKRHSAHAGCRRRRAHALQDRGTTLRAAALRRRTRVEMIRSLPLRAYLAVAALRDREEGQALVEYALLLSLIAVVSIGVLTLLGTQVSTIFSRVNSAL
jgi:Flp pilus assembly pilin Flp